MDNEKIIQLITELKGRVHVLEKSTETLERQQKETQELTISVRELAICTKNMTEEMKEQGERIRKLEEIPANRWEKAIGYLITTLLGAGISALIFMLQNGGI